MLLPPRLGGTRPVRDRRRAGDPARHREVPPLPGSRAAAGRPRNAAARRRPGRRRTQLSPGGRSMDDLTLMRSFRAERATRPPRPRRGLAGARGRFEPRRGERSGAPAAAPRRFLRRRRLFAFAGATAVAAMIAGVLVLDSGPTAQPAAAEILHRTAGSPPSSAGPAAEPLPGPGQFLYKKFERLELQSWIPGGDDERRRSAPPARRLQRARARRRRSGGSPPTGPAAPAKSRARPGS